MWNGKSCCGENLARVLKHHADRQPPSVTANRRRLPPNRRRLPPTAVGYPPTAVGYPPTAVRYPPRFLTENNLVHQKMPCSTAKFGTKVPDCGIETNIHRKRNHRDTYTNGFGPSEAWQNLVQLWWAKFRPFPIPPPHV